MFGVRSGRMFRHDQNPKVPPSDQLRWSSSGRPFIPRLESLGFSGRFYNVATALERNLARDLYDLTQFEPLTVLDKGTLVERLAHLEIGRAKGRKVKFEEAAKILQDKLKMLTQKNIAQELGGSLLEEVLPGLELLIRATVTRIAEQIRKMK
jgi:hypothetical protein